MAAVGLRTILEIVKIAGGKAVGRLDSTDDYTDPLLLEDIEQPRMQDVTLAPDAADQALTFTDALAILLISDGPFDLRVAAGNPLLENLRCFIVWADDADDGVHQTSVLLSGRGANTVIVTAVIIEKPTS